MADYGLGVAHGTIVISYDGAGVAKAQASVAGLEAKTKASGVRMAAAGKHMAKAGLVIAAGLGLAVHEAANFQSKMNLLVSAAGESPKALGAVSEGIKNIAIQTGTSLDDLAEGMYTVEKAGYRGAAGLAVLRAASEGARAENVDMATFTNALTSVMTSYSYKASDSVRVTNMLVAAAGRSKTTMQEFAGSLATVLPIASALGVSFPQVAGAISVLTQHGTSARESTQELANLIRNLAGQNNVAKASMEQLGINVIDLQKNLGKRGLSGTLGVVTAALMKHGKAGMIVTGALKQSATATAAMDTMLAKMPPGLRKSAKAFADNHISLKDFRSEIKGLGGPASVMGTNFLGLYMQSKGFSNALKSGNPQVATLAATLQKAMGGATGLRTALQLGVGTSKEGTASSKLFKDNVKAIGDEASKSGKDITTWARTQSTATVQFARLKAAGQVFAVNIGTVVLPAVVGIVKMLTHLIETFGHLPAPVQKAIGVGALLAAAFLLLGSLLIKLVTFGRKFYEMMKLMGSGIRSLIGFVTGMLEKLGILSTAEERAAAASEAASERQVAAAEATATAYEESVAAIQAAEAEVATAYEEQAAAANGSATEQEAAAVRVEEALAGVAAAATEAETRVSLAEEAEAAAAAEAATAIEEAEAAKAAAYRGSAAAATAAAEQTAVAQGAGAGAAGRGAVGGGGMRASGAGMALGVGGFIAGSAIQDGHGGARDNIGTVVKYAGAGAALGSFAGPEGAAIGAGIGLVAGGLKDLWDWQTRTTDAQKQLNTVMKNSEAVTADFSKSFTLNGKAAKDAATATATAALAQTDLTAKAAKAGLTQKDLTNAITGTIGQYNQTVRAWQAQGAPAQATLDTLAALRGEYHQGGDAARDMALAMGDALPGWRKTATGADLVTGKILKVAGAHETARQTGGNFNQALKNLSDSVKKNGTTLDQNTSFGRHNAQAIRRAAVAALAHSQAVYHQTGSVRNSLAVLQENRRRLLNAASAAGLNATEAHKLADRLYEIPHNPHSTIHINTVQAKADADGFASWYDGWIANLSSKSITPNVTPVQTPGHIGGIITGGGSSGGRSNGGWVPGSSTTRWPGAVHGREYVLSENMLRGRTQVDGRVMTALSKYQVAAMKTGGRSATAVAAYSPASGGGSGSAGGGSAHRIVGGTLEISRSSHGELRAWVQDMIAEEQDFHKSVRRMG